MHFYFVPNRLFWLVSLVICTALLFLMVLPVAAQEQTPVPTADDVVVVDVDPGISPVIPPDVIPVGDAATQLVALILNFLIPFGTSPLTTTLVSVVKLFTPANISAGLIKNVIAAILTVGYWLAVHYNFQDSFASVGQFLVTIVPAVFLLYKNFVDSSRIHEDAVKSNTALLSFKRTPAT